MYTIRKKLFYISCKNQKSNIQKLKIALFTALLSFTFSFQSTAQNASEVDSLALLDFYNATGGSTTWTNTFGWQNPANSNLSTWYGINLEPNGKYVEAINLNNNNLGNALPDTLNRLHFLKVLKLANNNIDGLPILDKDSLSLLSDVELQNNKLTFEDLEPITPLIGYVRSTQGNSFIYEPQDSVGLGGTFVRSPLGTITLQSTIVNSPHTTYEWFHNGNAIPNSNVQDLVLTDLYYDDAGTYYCKATNSKLDELTLYTKVFQLNIELCTDVNGNLIFCNQMMIRFVPGTTPAERQIERDFFGATPIDSCLCDLMELWQLPDGTILEGTNGSVADAQTREKLEDAGMNYAVFTPQNPSITPFGNEPGNGNQGTVGNEVIIAYIDSGIDFTHDSLTAYIWENT